MEKNTKRTETIADTEPTIELVTSEGDFTEKDHLQIKEHGIPLEKIGRQLDIFSNGIAKSVLDRPATAGDGILRLTYSQFEEFASHFDRKKQSLKLQKFVPASGAASRMFKFLSEFLAEYDPEIESINAYVNRKNAHELQTFLAGKEKFPFYEIVHNIILAKHPDFTNWERSKRSYYFIKVLLDSEYLDFANKPKGILPFHKYQAHIATPVEEHLTEAIRYSCGSDGKVNLHFTVSESHRNHFEEIVEESRQKIEDEASGTLNVTFSYQDTATDTIAVAPDNKPFRDSEGKLVFRPGGHGALIENLGKLEADVVFIKNIDNVIQDHVDTIAFYKKALGGILIQTQSGIFECLQKLDSDIDDSALAEIAAFITGKLNVEVTEDFQKFTHDHKITYLKKLLNRPIRVCGMVKNEGEPGGGPFWVSDAKGNLSLQIVESSQIDLQNERQAKILSRSTHFNPVDLVCGIKNYKGEKFHLTDYIDHASGFIVEKTKNGKPLKGYELPGLWNGAMAKWITLFVEVPLITFNPVKTVNDLLKPAHQPQ
ncbi:MAG TPA: DUF4301 family protein [Flavobacterium sp.]|jgi:hypothetical protein